ncbi:TPR-like protein [Amylostereum chailletii]|nr:TPR-like protein [Amylostereum chailletii]
MREVPPVLAGVGDIFYKFFLKQGRGIDIETAIAIHQRAVDLTPDDDPQKAAYLNNVGISFGVRFRRWRELADVDSSIRALRQAVEIVPESHVRRAMYLNHFGSCLRDRFEHCEQLPDIDSSIRVLRQAVNLTPELHPDKPKYLSNLGSSFGCRFQRLGELADIDSSISALRQAADLINKGHPEKPGYLRSLGISFLYRFQSLGKVDDLDNAISVHQQAVDLTPEDHEDKPGHLNYLGISFMRRFLRLGQLADVDSAISLQQQTVEHTPEADPEKPGYLLNLGTSLLTRLERLKDLADVDNAISVLQWAVNLTPKGHSDRPTCVNNLGIAFQARFRHLGELSDVNKSITLQQEAVELLPDGHAGKPNSLNNLGLALLARFSQSGEAADVDKSISALRRADDLTPDGHASKPRRLNNLGSSFGVRFQKWGDLADVDSTIRAQRQAVELTPDGHADKAMYLNNLAICLKARYERLGEMDDLHAAIDVSSKAAKDISGTPLQRFTAARRWAQLLSSEHSTTSPLDAYRTVIELIPRVVWLGSKLHRRYEELPSIAEVVSEAAAAAIAGGDMACALEWLEEGRCIIWGQMLQLRTPLDDLRAVDPKLANELERASRELDSAGTRQGPESGKEDEGVSLEHEAQRHRRLAENYERMIEKARALPGCEDLLRPKRLVHLRGAAESGPVVVVNIAGARCDALILYPSQASDAVLHIPLPTLDRDKVIRWNELMLRSLQESGVRARGSRQRPPAGEGNIMSHVLANLWSNIVRPVLLQLEPLASSWVTGDVPQITWCATGSLGFLPLHAAGLYDGRGGLKVYDFVVSSYTPTLSALLEARRHGRGQSTPSILAVSQPTTPGQSALPGTIAEIAAIKKSVGNLGLYLDKEEATKDSVLKAMADHSWIHLACHAHQHVEDPTKSAFILHNSRLELIDIMKSSFKHTELAVLSACQTATGDERLLEEAVHLAAGMLMAGYRSVIATMWSIKDADAPIVAEEFYSRLMEEGGGDGRKVAYALHDAVKRLRDQVGEEAFDRWVPFIHLGI